MPILRILQVYISLTGRVNPSEEQVPFRLKVVGPRALNFIPRFLFYFEAIELLELTTLDIEGISAEIKVGDHDSSFDTVDREHEYLVERQLLQIARERSVTETSSLECYTYGTIR